MPALKNISRPTMLPAAKGNRRAMFPENYVGPLWHDYADALVYMLSVLFAVAMVSWNMARRERFALRVCLSELVIAAFIVGVTYPIRLATESGTMSEYLIWFQTIKFFIVFVLSGVAVKVCFDCDWWAALFCATAGYCVQHIAARIIAIIQDIPMQGADWGLKLLVSVGLDVVIYLLFYIFIFRKLPKNFVVRITERWQVLLAACVVSISIFYNSFGISFAYTFTYMLIENGQDPAYGYYTLVFVYVMSLIIAVLALALEFGNARNKQLSRERDFLKQLLAEKRAQYENEKQTIELINIKVHDIKHQLASIRSGGEGGKVYDKQLSELDSAVNIYDTSLESGSAALDVVMRQKSLVCRNNGIRLTCMISGKKLAFIPEHEQYSLFCNAIDNAIDGVSALPEEKRVISLTEYTQGGNLVIRAENFFSGKINFSNDLPSTTKSGEGHGYGMKSMRMIVENHGGRLIARTEHETFIVEMVFPLSVVNAKSSDVAKV